MDENIHVEAISYNSEIYVEIHIYFLIWSWNTKTLFRNLYTDENYWDLNVSYCFRNTPYHHSLLAFNAHSYFYGMENHYI